jgi:outer membrane lipoprotein-sorting protein
MLRLLPTSRLIALIAAVLALLGGGTAIAVAALGGGGPVPPAKPLAQALHDAAAGPAVAGVTARITFTNHLIDSSSLPGGGANPLLSGATGRLWAAADGRLRLELQSDSGDAQVLSDGKTLTIFDGTSNSVYKITLPQDRGGAKDDNKTSGPPSVAKIQDFLNRVAESADLSGAKPSDVAGRAAYTTRISPKHDGGLVGAAELAFDAANGTPLRAAVYAAGNPDPVLELKATDITFGSVSDADLDVTPPAGAKVTTVDLSGAGQHDNGDPSGRKGPDAATTPKQVAAQVPFTLSAPDTLVGLPRHDVRVVDLDGEKGALVTYGAGLGGIAVLEQAAKPADPAAPGGRDGGGPGGLPLPRISIDGTSGQELATALGTLVRFERGGVQYTIVGSVPPAAAEAAARAL